MKPEEKHWQLKSTNRRFVISLHKFTDNLFHKLGELIFERSEFAVFSENHKLNL